LGSETVLFYVFGAIAVAASLLVIAQRNPVYSVLLLIASFGALSGLYVLLDAPFAAVIQIIVYAGAIMVLFLFVVMLLNAPHEDTDEDLAAAGIGPHPEFDPVTGAQTITAVPRQRRRGAMRFGAVLAAVLVLELVWALGRGAESGQFAGGSVSSVSAIGRSLFTDYALAFEVTSILILIAMVGSVVLARRDDPAEGEPR
jgi:NADH-quinone oxidoreductase subunit J